MTTETNTHLKICITELDNNTIKLYQNAINKFNKCKSDIHRDSGFDLFIPDEIYDELYIGNTIKVDHKVQCAMYSDTGRPLPYYLYPRSSISKTPLRLANSVGIIDSGYRGNLIAKLDYVKDVYVNDEKWQCPPGTRLMQICAHNLLPITSIKMVSSLDDTTRGVGGFGSTGK
jgi:dUTP pyrophosphatase